MVSKNFNEYLFENKGQVRAHFKQVAAQAFKQNEVSQNILIQLKSILPQGVLVSSYRARHDEPQLDELMTCHQYQIAYPRIGTDNSIHFLKTKNDSDFAVNSFGIYEPIEERSERVDLNQLVAVIVPGLAFDRKLNRLGRGKGHYDRVLANYKGIKIGVCSAQQILNEELSVEPHDIKMDIIVTDKFILRRLDS